MGWGPHLRVLFDGGAHIAADFPDCAADLPFADFHPRFDYHAIAMPGRKLAGAAHHFEVSGRMTGRIRIGRSEEHTSELQSLMRISYAVFCLKKQKYNNRHKQTS